VDPLTASIEELALEHAESFVNGNRVYVIKEIQSLPVKEAIAVSARVSLELDLDHRCTFVRLTEYFAENKNQIVPLTITSHVVYSK